MKKKTIFLLAIIGLVLISAATLFAIFRIHHRNSEFDGKRAYDDVLYQVSLGPRTPGSEAHAQVILWMKSELEEAGWTVEIQETEMNGYAIQNVIAHRSNLAPKIILGAHYDCRLIANRDQGPGSSGPVPGANDGASGVAILLELARTLPPDSIPLWLVFFDAEDNGDIEGREWIMGSRAFVDSLEFYPEAAVSIDMVGDTDLNIYIESHSNPELVTDIWAQAAALGYSKQFIAETNTSVTDDHIPFIDAGIPAVDIIDFDYPYWHTSEDTADKVSADSLKIVGETLWHWIANFK